MKILYGVQGTGNGHITRARAMRLALEQTNADVDYLFSGRSPDRYFDMAEFGACAYRAGLTLSAANGRVSYSKTVLNNSYRKFARDVRNLDLSKYTLVITDFEPVTAWAGMLRGKTVISLGHQPAFDFAIPKAGRDLRSALLMRLFAPGHVRIGMHWNPFGAPLLPPMIELPAKTAGVAQPRKVLVYLPFENERTVLEVLAQVPSHEFFVYGARTDVIHNCHLHLRPPSVPGFRADLESCSAVIANAGFELASECLAHGKRLIVKPVERQMEQLSNALALEQLGFADVMTSLDSRSLFRWLHEDRVAPKLVCPDVAAALASWIGEGDFRRASLDRLSADLWNRTQCQWIPHQSGATVARTKTIRTITGRGANPAEAGRVSTCDARHSTSTFST
ncbi:MAG: MJ1255/VC2487 family glycosyltransferase [Pseudomonadota bacterium]